MPRDTETDEPIESASTRPLWTRVDWLALTIITLVGAAVRGIRLLQPTFWIGDERFYSTDACWYAFGSEAICDSTHEVNLEHPPLAKWIISWAVQIWGDTRFSHRIGSVIFGVATIALLYVLARRLLRSTLGASIAAGGLALDFMHFVHSRVAMLDVYLLFFSVLAYLFLVLDRDALFKGGGRGSRPWQWAAGAGAGAAIATKWTGLLVLFGLVFLAFAWESKLRRDRKNHLLATLREQGPRLLLSFGLVPLLAYAATFIGRVHGTLLAAPWSDGSWWAAFAARQTHIFRFHAHHIWEHHWASAPWSWPLVKRAAPLAYDLHEEPFRLVADGGNPVIWSLAFVSLAYLAIRWARRQDPLGSEGTILGGFVWAYPPWLVYYLVPYVFFTWGRSALFIWYLMPALPFMYLALGYVAIDLARVAVGRTVVIGVSLFAAIAFAFYYPVLTWIPLSPTQFDARLFAFDDCDRPEHEDFVFFRRNVVNGETRFERIVEPAAPHLQPLGWCWLP